jgi:hypothetical protein
MLFAAAMCVGVQHSQRTFCIEKGPIAMWTGGIDWILRTQQSMSITLNLTII